MVDSAALPIYSLLKIRVTHPGSMSIYTVVEVEHKLCNKFEQALEGDAYKAAWRYSWRLCGKHETAEDLLQESLAHAFVKFPQVRDANKFRGWLLNIVRTQFLTQKRRGERQPKTTGDFESQTPSTPHLHPSHIGIPTNIAAALERLPGVQREAMELHYIDELEIVEVAQVLKIKPNAVKARLHRGRLAMKKALGVVPAKASLQGGQTDE